jgi:cell division protease FtsH
MNTVNQKLPNKKNSLITLVFVALLLAGYLVYTNPTINKTEKISLSEFQNDISESTIDDSKVFLEGNKISYERNEGESVYTFKEPSANFTDFLTEEELSSINLQVDPENTFYSDLLLAAIPVFLIVVFFLFMFKQAQSSNSQAMSFGKSNAKIHDKTKEKTLFKDVAGAEEAKNELEEIVDFLKFPLKYTKIGAKIPKGVLMIGAPGTGKTLLARAVAGEADVPFFSISGSEFVEMFVGVGASRVRDLFKKAKRNSPCIIFIDEIDAVGRQRGAGMGGGHDEREQTLNQILTEMDGFEKGDAVIVMAATNRPDVLDPALQRPGRFDRKVVVDKPDINDREKILAVHGRNKPLEKAVDLNKIARQTPGSTGADLENIMNEAAILAAKNDQKTITQENLEMSVEKVALGPEKKSRVLNVEERKITSYHEVGHAFVGQLTKGCDPVHKVSIISRGQALGVTWYLPTEDKHLYSKSKFQAELCSLLGGYVAEEVFFGEVTTGASSDLQRATGMARRMVTEFGMSDLGPVVFGEKNHEVFLGRDYGHTKNYSEDMSAKIDARIKEFIDAAYKRTKELITANKAKMVEISEDLLVKETLTREEFIAYFGETDAPKEVKKAKKEKS